MIAEHQITTYWGSSMHKKIAFALAMLLAACDSDPCGAERVAASAVAGGPIGLLVNYLACAQNAAGSATGSVTPVADNQPHPEPIVPPRASQTPQPQPMPEPMPDSEPMPPPLPEPMPDSDSDGFTDDVDRCPMLAGALSGCPQPKTITAQLKPMPSAGVTTTATGFRFTANSAARYVDFVIALPPEAATAKSITSKWQLQASAQWGASSSWCSAQGRLNKHLYTDNAGLRWCVTPGYRVGLATVDLPTDRLIEEAGRPSGETPAQFTAAQSVGFVGQLDARKQNVIRLLVQGDADLSSLQPQVTLTLSWL